MGPSDLHSWRPAAAPLPGDFFHYAHPAPAIRPARLDGEDERHYEVSALVFPSVGENGQPDNRVSARYYRARGPDHERPLVIVLPLWGTSDYPPTVVARSIRNRSDGDMHVVQMDGPNYLFDWDAMAAAPDSDAFFEQTQTMAMRMRNTVVDVRRLIDWAEGQPEIDPERIGLVGFSMSAVAGGLVLGTEPRLSAAVMLMGGAHPSQIAARCNGPLEGVRRAIVGRLDWDNDTYTAQVARAWGMVDPARYPSLLHPSRVLMIDSFYDECMPQSSRDDYWLALGQPKRLTLWLGHRHSFYTLTPIGLSLMRGRVYRHLSGKLLD